MLGAFLRCKETSSRIDSLTSYPVLAGFRVKRSLQYLPLGPILLGVV